MGCISAAEKRCIEYSNVLALFLSSVYVCLSHPISSHPITTLTFSDWRKLVKDWGESAVESTRIYIYTTGARMKECGCSKWNCAKLIERKIFDYPVFQYYIPLLRIWKRRSLTNSLTFYFIFCLNWTFLISLFKQKKRENYNSNQSLVAITSKKIELTFQL